MLSRRSLLVSGISLVTVASCGPPTNQPRFPDIRFIDDRTILLQASRVEIRTSYRESDIDRGWPVPPVQAVQNWARDRLRASGVGSVAQFTIIDASAVEKNLPVKGGISGALTDQVSQEYDVSLEATLNIVDDHGMVIRGARATAMRSNGVRQSASPNERDQVRYDLVKALMADFDQQMDSQIRDNFGPYLIAR